MSIIQSLLRFLDKYGFRCINEQKLEENSLHDDPGRVYASLLLLPPSLSSSQGFVIDAITGYIHTKAYSVSDMEEREIGIRQAAETIVSQRLSWPKKLLFNWILFHARRSNKVD